MFFSSVSEWTTAKRMALVICMSCLSATSVLAQVTAIQAGQLVDPETGTVTSDQTILVEAGLITAVGSDVAIPSGANIVDLSTSTVLPGLIDAHVHL